MRILHFLWSLGQGGAESLAVDLANRQCREQDVTMMVANQAIDAALLRQLDPSIRLVHLKRPEGSRNPVWIVRLLTAIRALQPDVIHSHAGNLERLANFIKAPLILTVHASNVHLPCRGAKFAAICCISKAVESDIRRRYPRLIPRLVANGIDTSAIRVRCGPAQWPLRAVQVSRLAHQIKGQDLLVEALAIVNAGGDQPRLTADFIGQGGSLAFLADLAATRGVAPFCNFLGSQAREQIFHNLRHYDILVQPSRDEGFGLTIAEGMAAGIPVVVSDIPGPMEVIDHGRYGYHFRCNDSTALAETLESVIKDIKASKLEGQLRAARMSVIDRFDIERTCSNYLEIYKAVAQSTQQTLVRAQ